MKRVLLVADLHTGSLFSPRSSPDNSIQRATYNKWKEMCKAVGPVDAVILNGDLCDGINYKSRGIGIWTSNIEEQIDEAVNLIQMIDTKKYYGTQGSFYHVGDNLSSDRLVLKLLNGTFGDELAIKIEDVRFHCMHSVGVSSSAWMYRTTPIAREMLMAELNKEEYGKFKAIIRSHAHYFCYAGFGSSFGMISPCWKGRDEFAKRRTLAFMPHLGYVLFTVDGSHVSWEPHLFTLKGSKIMEEVTV
jgi:predicted phosphodiesterase